jgi:hypothetical protein
VLVCAPWSRSLWDSGEFASSVPTVEFLMFIIRCALFLVSRELFLADHGQEGQAIKPACQRQRYITLLARGGAQCAAQYVWFAGWQLASLRSSPPHFRAFELVSALATRWLANARTHTHTPHSLNDELVSHHLSLLPLVGLVWPTCIART